MGVSNQERALIGLHIARGKAHVAKCGLVHRDLAARNVLVASGTSGSRVFRIADFGLARAARAGADDNVENAENLYTSRGGLVPIKWTAPEALDGKFSTASDVWAFGITMVEVYTDGKTPYPGLTGNEVSIGVSDGSLKPEQPPLCPSEAFVLMAACWSFDSAERPQFASLVTGFEGLELLRGVDAATE